MHLQILIPESLFMGMVIVFIFLFIFIIAWVTSFILFPDIRKGLIEDFKRPIKW